MGISKIALSRAGSVGYNISPTDAQQQYKARRDRKRVCPFPLQPWASYRIMTKRFEFPKHEPSTTKHVRMRRTEVQRGCSSPCSTISLGHTGKREDIEPLVLWQGTRGWWATGAELRGAHQGAEGDLLLIVQLAVELLVPIEAGGLQGLLAGCTLDTLLMPQAVVEAQQEPIRNDSLAPFAHRLRGRGSACGEGVGDGGGWRKKQTGRRSRQG